MSIYLDYNASAPISSEVLEYMIDVYPEMLTVAPIVMEKMPVIWSKPPGGRQRHCLE